MDWIRISIPKKIARTIGFKSPSNRFESQVKKKEETKAMDSNPHKKDSIPFEDLSSTNKKEKKSDLNLLCSDSNL